MAHGVSMFAVSLIAVSAAHSMCRAEIVVGKVETEPNAGDPADKVIDDTAAAKTYWEEWNGVVPPRRVSEALDNVKAVIALVRKGSKSDDAPKRLDIWGSMCTPSLLVVRPGTTLVISNKDTFDHEVTMDEGEQYLIKAGAQQRVTVGRAGRVEVKDARWPELRATIHALVDVERTAAPNADGKFVIEDVEKGRSYALNVISDEGVVKTVPITVVTKGKTKRMELEPISVSLSRRKR